MSGITGFAGFVSFNTRENVKRKEEVGWTKSKKQGESTPAKPANPGRTMFHVERGGLMSVIERAELREQVGRAVQASALTVEPDRRGAADMMMALGIASLEAGAPRLWEAEGAVKAGPRKVRDEREQVGADLAALLWRAKYGADAEAERAAAVYLAGWLLLGEPFWNELHQVAPGVVLGFSRQAVDEYVHHRCPTCGGNGRQQMFKGQRTRIGGWLWQKAAARANRAARRAPVGQSGDRKRVEVPLSRNARVVPCRACDGTGARKVAPGERRKALGARGWSVGREDYDLFWRRRFALTRRALASLERSLNNPLRAALGGRNVRPA